MKIESGPIAFVMHLVQRKKKTLTNLKEKKDVSVVSWLETADSNSHNRLVFVWII